MTADEALELARLESHCRELEAHKGITDTVHHDRLRELRQRAGATSSFETIKETQDDDAET